MKKSLLALIPLALMFAAIFAPMAFSGPTQPPVGTGTLYVGRAGWGPGHADPARAHDKYSQELIFNAYDRLIMFGKDQTNEWGTWDVHEQYWEFQPCLATNVPDRFEVTADFTNTSFVWIIVIRSEVPLDPGWIFDPICTWWEDDLVEPFNSYHITDWIDNGDGQVGFCDYIFVNDYWWAPEILEEVHLKDARWWHVEDVQDHGDGLYKMILTYTTWTDFDPDDPECTWWTSEDYPERMFHLTGWVDNNPLEPYGLENCDVVYMMEYQWVPVFWEKIGEGWTLLPVTCRTWHVTGWGPGDPIGVTLYLHRWYYDFNIRTDPTINFVDETGGIVDTFDIYDVEYSFKRGLVRDPIGGPMWKFYQPLFDQMNSDSWDTGEPADTIELAYLIEDAIQIISTDPPILRINIGIDFPDNAFKQILCGTWASIMSREFSIAIGDWDGELFLDMDHDCFPDWFETVRHEPSPYETNWRYVGTGPYYVSIVDDMNDIVILNRNAIYWMGWPAQDRKAYLNSIDIEYISEWSTRRDAFIACQLDICYVPRAYMSELLDEWNEPKYDEIVTIKNIYPGMEMDAVIFTFMVNPASPYIGTGEPGPDGIPPNFFNDPNNRKAFAYAFNHAAYLGGAYHGEAICRETPLISGLAPDYYSYGPDPPYVYDESLEMAELCLVASGAAATGFYVVMGYDTGNVEAYMACLMIRDFFQDLDPRYIVDIVELDWPTFQSSFEIRMLPVCVMPWHANYADADDFMRPFMHSEGYFAYFQGYTLSNGWNTPGPASGLIKDELVDLAVKTPDGPERAALYKDLEDIYIEDCPSYPIAEPLGRRWQKYWVKGWYHNALYPSDYYYHLYKEDACWCDVTGPTFGVPDGVSHIRDIAWICGHFGAKPPDVILGYNPLWAPGTYGYATADVYGDRKVDMRDIGLACAHFMHTNEP